MKSFILCLFLLWSSLSFAQSAPSPSWWQTSLFYEIFVRSFQDSTGHGVGDLKGVTSRLDYLKALGVDTVWLMPIFSSPSYHGYDTIDYRAIQPDYGTMADFKQLLAQAHSRGIRVILDLAINHTSDQNPWFTQNADWYLWSDHAVTPWIGPGHWIEASPSHYYYATFSKNMPDLNWHNLAVRAEVESILQGWSALGVDGFRLDAARYYVKGPEGEMDTPGTHQAIQEFVQDLKQDYPNAMFVGEVWDDHSSTIAPYVNSGQELDLAFDFPLAFALVRSLQQDSAASFLNAIRDNSANIAASKTVAPFLTNHDMVRIATQLKGNIAKLKLAAQLLFTLPGTPFMYYGEEIGIPNGATAPSTDDKNKRTPMQWDGGAPNFGFTSPQATPWTPFSPSKVSVAAEWNDPNSLLATYRQAIALRRSTPALQTGNFNLFTSSNPQVAIYGRTLGTSKVITFANFGASLVSSLSVNAYQQVVHLENLAPYSLQVIQLSK